MARVPKVRKHVPSTKSRAARRALSPPEKGLVPATDNVEWSYRGDDTARTTAEDLNNVLARQSYAGISKKAKKKQLSRQQRVRKEKGMDRAVAFSEQLEQKTDKSKEKGKTIKARRGTWEDHNSGAKDAKVQGDINSFNVLEVNADDDLPDQFVESERSSTASNGFRNPVQDTNHERESEHDDLDGIS